MDSKELTQLLNQLIKALEGDWILIGGALLHQLKVSDRPTLDIDLVPMMKVTNQDQLKVLDVAVRNGFPPETINFAAEYFVKKHPDWRENLILIKKTKKARIFRPNLAFFKRLKEARGTETDYLDIAAFEAKIRT